MKAGRGRLPLRPSPRAGTRALPPCFLLVFAAESLAPARALWKGRHAACSEGSITWRRSRGRILSHHLTHRPWAGQGDPLHSLVRHRVKHCK